MKQICTSYRTNTSKRLKGLCLMLTGTLFIFLFPLVLFAQVNMSAPDMQKYRQQHSYNKAGFIKKNGMNALKLSNLLSVKPADSISNPLLQLIQSLVGSGVTVSNIKTTLPQTSDIYGSFSGGTNVIGMESGLIMTTGSVFNALGPNASPSTSQDNGLPGYLQIDTAGFDAAVISFDVKSNTSFLSFRYVFASEEYNEFVGTQYNDDFAFLISGPGIPAGTNIAIIPGTNHAVDINDVNLLSNAQYYINNDSVQYADPVRFQNLEYDGLTKVLTTASITVVPGATYTITLVIQDVADPIYDSGVFLEGGSITSDSCVLHLEAEKKDITCFGEKNGSIDLSVTGFNGTPHYAWTNGDTTQDIFNLGPGNYNVTVTDDKGCTKSLPSPVVIIEPAALLLDTPKITSASCGGGNNGSAIVKANGGTPPYKYTLDTVVNNTGIFTNLAAGSYNYAVSDSNNCSTTGSFVIPQGSDINCSIFVFINPALFGQAKNTIFIGYGPQAVTLTGIIKKGKSGPYTYDWGAAGKGKTIIVRPKVTTTYTLTVADKNGCQSTCSVIIYVQDIRCGDNLNKVLVCHEDSNKAEHTICINKAFVLTHLLHGDRLGSCEASSVIASVNTGASSISEFTKLTFKITPNPSPDYFMIQIGSNNTIDKIGLRIFDLNGRQIESKDHLKSGQQIQLGFNYKPGVYMVELTQGSQRITARLVKL